jgi:SEC-C motif
MLYLSKSLLKEMQKITDDADAGRLDPRVAGERLVRMCPEFLPAYALLDRAYELAGDEVSADMSLWRCLEHDPAHFLPYFLMSVHRKAKDPDDVIAKHLLEMACWKISLDLEVPEMVEDHFQNSAGPEAELDFSEPETFGMLATVMELNRQKEGDDPPEVVEKLLPFRLFSDLERQAEDAVDPVLLNRLREHAARCVPILYAAIRGWANFGYGTEASISMTAALLGELGSIELLPDLLELSQRSRPPLFLHVNWAIYRLARRFPEPALECLHSLIASANVGVRCAIAEHLIFMDNLPGVAQVFRELLDGFRKLAKHHDAPYLLRIVLHGLTELEEDSEKIDELERQCRPLLNREGRNWFQQSEDSFEPLLVENDIEDLTLEDVCLERLLMDDDQEDEDEYYQDVEEDGEDEDHERELAPRIRPNRNDPCWCGSGKKYKKCHLAADEQSDRQAPPQKKEPASMPSLAKSETSDLIPQLIEMIPRKASSEAVEQYFADDPESVFENQDQRGMFIQWLLFDFRLPGNGRTVVEEFRNRRSHNLSPASRRQLEAWSEMRMQLLEVQRVDEGRGVEMKDLLAGGVFFVNDVSASRELVQWDCVINRVYRIGDRREFAGDGLGVPRNMLPKFLQWIEDERGEQRKADFLAANSHQLHRVLRQMHNDRVSGLQAVNFEGHPIAFGEAVYRVNDEAAVLNTLRGRADFVEDSKEGPVVQFGWLAKDEAKDGSRQRYGGVILEKGELRLETNSENRLERGRKLLEVYAGEWLEHVKDTVTPFEEVKRRALKNPKGPAPEPIPPDVERQIVQQYKEQHYSTWPDEALPALDGKTPREAVQTREGRKQVEELLRQFENGEARERKAGHAAFDFSGIRKELGIGE